MSNTSKLSFQIEVRRVLEILSNDIYDSPYALLRENIQNGYDAILMRMQLNGKDSFAPKINVNINSKYITIEDNGIGMNRDVVSNNFWKAGSSGKNNEIAQKAGVVGTFGIGAMANFGVCKSIKVITHYAQGNETIETFARRESLSITEECIDIKTIVEEREAGTQIIAELDDALNLTAQGAISYLNPYVKHLNIPVIINGTTVSQNKYTDIFEVRPENLFKTESHKIVTPNNSSFTLQINYTNQNIVKVYCSDITRNGQTMIGDIVLSQGGGGIYGLRNYFGLAPIPVSGFFNLGGVVNLSVLHPTAGREALSRESIELVSQIINSIEAKIAESISHLDIADLNSGFLNYLSSNNKFELAKNLKIVVQPNDERWSLSKIASTVGGKKVYYYSGRDSSTILQFGNENSYLLLLSQDNPRRRIQLEYIKRLGVEEVPDKARVLKVFETKELSFSEVTLILRITNILNEDYLIADSKVYIADISHQVPSLIEHKDNVVIVYLSRQSSAVQQVLQIYSTDWSLFGSFVKDFVRNHLYQKFAPYVPSSTRQGADALHKILMRNRELYKYEYSDLGALESLLSEYVSGDIDFPEVLKKSTTIIRTHSQFVRKNQVGTVEQEIPSIIEDNTADKASFDEYGPVPPIIRRETKTDKKILKTDKPYPHLNDFSLFLSLSDKLFKSQLEFFLEPHTTKVIWSMHKVVYIFTHASNNLSLYYDIELKEKLSDESTGGKAVPTTTIITENRIFIPIITELNSYFDIHEGTKEFYVRYDIITDFSNS
ncbi:MAG: ATP-binding protein [Cyclobacteriaceae bacterium]|nr:ATP-binding protein [Cyclobacteriaceae bacterium]